MNRCWTTLELELLRWRRNAAVVAILGALALAVGASIALAAERSNVMVHKLLVPAPLQVSGLQDGPTLQEFLYRRRVDVHPLPIGEELFSGLASAVAGAPVLIVPPEFEQSLAEGRPARLQLLWIGRQDLRAQPNDFSNWRRAVEILRSFEEEHSSVRLQALGLAPWVLETIVVEQHDLRTPIDIAHRLALNTALLLTLSAATVAALGVLVLSPPGLCEDIVRIMPSARASPSWAVMSAWIAAVLATGLWVLTLLIGFVIGQTWTGAETTLGALRLDWPATGRAIAILWSAASVVAASCLATGIWSRRLEIAGSSKWATALRLAPTLVAGSLTAMYLVSFVDHESYMTLITTNQSPIGSSHASIIAEAGAEVDSFRLHVVRTPLVDLAISIAVIAVARAGLGRRLGRVA